MGSLTSRNKGAAARGAQTPYNPLLSQQRQGLGPPIIPYNNNLYNNTGLPSQLGRPGTPPPMPYNNPYLPQPGAMSNTGLPPPMPYNNPYQAPPSPNFQRMGGQMDYPYPHHPPMGAGLRDTDFSSVASIAGLNPADIALLHREFQNLTYGGTHRIDRPVFRQLLRDILIEVNNENVDRTIENLFVRIDRNHDGFIDFPEFVGAFKDVLKGYPTDPQSYFAEHAFPDMLSQQLKASGVGSGILSQPSSIMQSPAYHEQQQAHQLVSPGGLSLLPLASTGIQQSPLMYGSGGSPLQVVNANPPVLSLDRSQSSYVIATPGQYLITQPTAMQCMPLPMM